MNQRLSRQTVLMKSAFLWAERSTCSRLHVGAIFAREGRILVTGYNGAPSGLPHCDHSCSCGGDFNLEHLSLCPADKPCTTAVHAEQNGISYAAKWGIKLEDSELYVTHMPCLTCALSLVNVGIKRVFYSKPFRDHSGIRLLESAGIEVLDYQEGEMIK